MSLPDLLERVDGVSGNLWAGFNGTSFDVVGQEPVRRLFFPSSTLGKGFGGDVQRTRHKGIDKMSVRRMLSWQLVVDKIQVGVTSTFL